MPLKVARVGPENSFEQWHARQHDWISGQPAARLDAVQIIVP